MKAKCLLLMVLLLFVAVVRVEAEEKELLFRALVLMDNSGELEQVAERVSLIVGTQLVQDSGAFKGSITLGKQKYKITLSEHDGKNWLEFENEKQSVKMTSLSEAINSFISAMNSIYGKPETDRYLGSQADDNTRVPRTKKGQLDYQRIVKDKGGIMISWNNQEGMNASEVFGGRTHGDGTLMSLTIILGTYK